MFKWLKKSKVFDRIITKHIMDNFNIGYSVRFKLKGNKIIMTGNECAIIDIFESIKNYNSAGN